MYHFYVIYWYRVINETSAALDLTVNFPADSFATAPLPEANFKVVLPPDTMSLDKEGLIFYGATDLLSFLEAGLNKPTRLQRTISPKEAYMFYVSVRYTADALAPPRTEFVLREQKLFYLISGIEVPCGQIVFKK